MATEKKVVLINNSRRTIHTAKGEFSPGESLEFSEKEAEMLLDYQGIVDAAKWIKPGAANDKLKAENAKLVQDLKDALELVKKLDVEILAGKEKIAELEKKLKK